MRSLGLGLGFNRHRILGGVVPLLDTYTGASAAYSLRNLSSSTTNVVRVRRSSNDDEQDFTASEVSGGALTTFVGAGNDGFVTTWYDQVPFEEVTGTELVTQFDGVADGTDVTTLTNWSAYNVPTSRNVVNEALVIVASGGNQGAIYSATTTIGNKYLFTCDVSGDLGAGALYFPATSDGAKNVSTAGGSVRFFFEASVTSTGIFFRANSNGAGTTTYSNISLKEVDRIANDATQTSASAQPKIVDSGSLITENSKPTIKFDGTSDKLFSVIQYTPTTSMAQIIVAKGDSASTDQIIGDNNDRKNGMSLRIQNSNFNYFNGTGAAFNSLTHTANSNQNLHFYGRDTSSSFYARLNSSEVSTSISAISTTDLNIFLAARHDSSLFLDGNIQEYILYLTSQSSNKTAIEDNINSHYNIYT